VTTKKDITAIIPTFNRPEKTLRAIESILNQTQPVDEILVVDDASKKHFECKRDPKPTKVKVLRHDRNMGVSCARNTGIKEASNDWLAFLDSDDEWDPVKIEKQTQDQKNNTDTLFFYTEENWLRNGKVVRKKKHQKKHAGWIFEECLKQCFIGASTLLVHKSVFDEVGFFDTELTVCEDYDFWIRASHKYKVHFNEEALIDKYGGHEDQLSTKYFAMDYYRLLSLVKVYKILDLSENESSYVKEHIGTKYKILKSGAEKYKNTELLEKLSKIIY